MSKRFEPKQKSPREIALQANLGLYFAGHIGRLYQVSPTELDAFVITDVRAEHAGLSSDGTAYSIDLTVTMRMGRFQGDLATRLKVAPELPEDEYHLVDPDDRMVVFELKASADKAYGAVGQLSVYRARIEENDDRKHEYVICYPAHDVYGSAQTSQSAQEEIDVYAVARLANQSVLVWHNNYENLRQVLWINAGFQSHPVIQALLTNQYGLRRYGNVSPLLGCLHTLLEDGHNWVDQRQSTGTINRLHTRPSVPAGNGSMVVWKLCEPVGVGYQSGAVSSVWDKVVEYGRSQSMFLGQALGECQIRESFVDGLIAVDIVMPEQYEVLAAAVERNKGHLAEFISEQLGMTVTLKSMCESACGSAAHV